MKKVLMLMVILFSQVFFTSESLHCSEMKENSKDNLFPAGNDSGD